MKAYSLLSEQDVSNSIKKNASFLTQAVYNNGNGNKRSHKRKRDSNNPYQGGQPNQGYNNNNYFKPNPSSAPPNHNGKNPNIGNTNYSKGNAQGSGNSSSNFPPKSVPEGQPSSNHQPSSKPKFEKKGNAGKKIVQCEGCFYEYPSWFNHHKGNCPFDKLNGFGHSSRTKLTLTQAQVQISLWPRTK